MNDVDTQHSETLHREAVSDTRYSVPPAARLPLRSALVLVLIAAVAALAWFFFLHRGSAESEAEVKPSARVETVPLQKGPIAETLESFGAIEAAPGADHTTPATYECVVVAVHVATGAKVNAGDVVMEIAPSPDAKLQSESARTTLKLAQQSLAATQERYDLKLATTQDLLTAQQAERDAQQKVASYEARGMSGNGKLRAPVTGMVSKLDALAGSLIAAGAPLFSVATEKHLEARLSVESAFVRQLAPGQSVTLESTDREEPVTVTSTVRAVGNSVNVTTGSADVRVPLPESAPLLLGEHVKATIELVKKDSVLVVPRSAVLPDDDKQVLYTVKDGKAVRHEVTLGITGADVVEVQSPDLQPGDAVVTLGNYELNDGMSILTADKESDAADAKDGKDDAQADDKAKDSGAKGAEAKAGGAKADGSKADDATKAGDEKAGKDATP